MPEFHTFRIADWDTPLRVNPNRTAGRFHDAHSPATQYLGLHPLTPWAEYLRTQGLDSADAFADLQLTVWAVRIRVDRVLELDYERASDVGLVPEDLISDDWAPCQEFADQLREDAAGPRALVVPSAALPGTRNLVVLEPRVAIPYSWDPIDEGDCPAAVAAMRACPPDSLLPLIRWRGQPHAEFEAWSRGHHFAFVEPAL